MKKILYLMAIDWHWIKQRPQIFAEMLSRDYEVSVLYYKEVLQHQMLRKDQDELERSESIPAIPFRDKNRIAGAVQKLFFQKKIRNLNQYDIIWVSHPMMYRLIPADYHGVIVYDCMDNHEALCPDPAIRKNIKKTEKELTLRADKIIVSSSGLLKKISSLNPNANPVLIRNGYPSSQIHEVSTGRMNRNKDADFKYELAYFGTIGEWFDFESILKCLDYFPGLEMSLWGPVSHVTIPKHPRLKLKGVVEHQKLWDAVKETDCLIMPFQLNDIVKDVDPVKLYEYISMGKSIISVYYEEVRRFADFVSFYRTADELIEVAEKEIQTGFRPKYRRAEQQAFLKDNSWEARYQTIRQEILNKI